MQRRRHDRSCAHNTSPFGGGCRHTAQSHPCTSTHYATCIVVMAMYWRVICHHTSVQPPAAHNLGLRPVLCSLLSVGCMRSRRNFGGSGAARKNQALVPQLSFDQINQVERCATRSRIFPLFQNSLIFSSVALLDFSALGPYGLS